VPETQTLGSRYVLEQQISCGGMGSVWWGHDRMTGQRAAVKLLHERLMADPKMVTRLIRERAVLIGLRHPSLVPVRDVIVEGDRAGLVMDLVQGMDLYRHLQVNGPFPAARAASLIAQVCDALAVVHAAGVVHRDLKPSNILLDANGPGPVARLTDFGLAWTEDSPQLTTEGTVLGTPAYFAPEVVMGRGAGPPVDVYAAGICLYELLTGRAPYAVGPPDAIMWRHVTAEPLRPAAIPEPLWEIITACLAKEPDQRPDAAMAGRRLRDCLPALEGLPAAPRLPASTATFRMSDPKTTAIPAGPQAEPPAQAGPGPSPPAPRRVRQRPAVRLTAIVIGLILLAGTAALTGARFWPASHTAALAGHTPTPARPDPAATPAHSPARHTSRSSPATKRPRAAATQDRSGTPQTPAAAGAGVTSPVSKVLYSFRDGTADGWQAGANITQLGAVTSFADAPGRPFDSSYALDAFSNDGATIPTPLTVSVSPGTALDLSAAQTFYLYEDGYGYSPYATGYQLTVTLASGRHSLTKTVAVRCNHWNRIQISLSSWAYRDRVTGITVSYAGIGSDTQWFPHFQIDDVGYLT
jgi:serine/threonine protein kinase, bacterial